MSDAEAELARKSKKPKRDPAEPRKDVVSAAVGRRVACYGTGSERGRVARGTPANAHATRRSAGIGPALAIARASIQS